MNTKKTKEAVSLIVLVLTIVIMIILAGVIVINLNNSGIIDRAKGAVSETNLKNMQELANVAWGEAYLSIKGEKTAENLKSTMLEKLKGKGVSDDELGKYTFVVTTGGVEVAVNTGSGEETPEPEEPVIDPLNPIGTIPEGAVYYRYDELPENEEYSGLYIDYDTIADEATAFEAGNSFPDTIERGDVYIYNGYIYVYGYYSGALDWNDKVWFYANGNLGWNVRVVGYSIEEAPELLESINGKTLTGMESAFIDCSKLTKAPVIPSTVVDMGYTFYGCSLLTSITVNATPTDYHDCLGASGVTEILGDCDENVKEEILATKEY